jgi:hypothetical protein
MVGSYRRTESWTIPNARLRLPEIEIRITQDATHICPDRRVKAHTVNINYGWTGSSWSGSLGLTLDPTRNVVASQVILDNSD